MLHRTLLVALCLAVTAGTAAPARAAAARTRKSAAKVSSSQLFQRLDIMDAKMDQLLKGIGSAQQAAAAAAGRPVVQGGNPGEARASREMSGAFYNYGVYMKSAQDARLASRLVRDLCVLGGGILAIDGWQSAHDKTVPRTMANAYKDYPGFSFGVTTMLVGVIVGEFVEMSANRDEARAARALMKPLEETPDTVPAAPAAAAPAHAPSGSPVVEP